MMSEEGQRRCAFLTKTCLEEFRVGLKESGGNSRMPDDKNVPSVKMV